MDDPVIRKLADKYGELQRLLSNLYGVDVDDLAKIEEISLKWKPNRSMALRYLWKSLDSI